MEKVKVAVIGVGAMGRNHARVYSEMPECRLVAVADVDKEKSEEIADKFNCRYYLDYKKMLEQEDIEAVSIAVPTKFHKDVSIYVIEKGIHLLLEKPIAGTVEEAEEIIKMAKEKKIKLLIGHIERFNPAVIELKKIVGEGKLGSIISIIARRVGLFPPRIKDANIVIDTSVHDIDIIRYIMGSNPDKIYSLGGKSLNENREDHVMCLMKYGNANVVIQSNWITPIKIRNLSVTGTKGYAELDYVTQELILYESNYETTFDDYGDFIVKFGKQNTIKVDVKFKEPLKGEIEHFFDCIKFNESPLVSGEEALEALKIALDINDKLKNGY